MSGHQINKYDRLVNRYVMGVYAGLPFFKAAAGYMELAFTTLTPIAGDHVLAVARVVHSKNCHDTPILTTDYLKEHKFTR
jgi:flavin reductase (DIM6/NTAB) family NADH-FMN oxidoreductase RutF